LKLLSLLPEEGLNTITSSTRDSIRPHRQNLRSQIFISTNGDVLLEHMVKLIHHRMKPEHPLSELMFETLHLISLLVAALLGEHWRWQGQLGTKGTEGMMGHILSCTYSASTWGL
jgi:hypothetical protein